MKGSNWGLLECLVAGFGCSVRILSPPQIVSDAYCCCSRNTPNAPSFICAGFDRETGMRGGTTKMLSVVPCSRSCNEPE